jgi:hypothetical protein
MGNYSPHFYWKFPRCEEVFVSKKKIKTARETKRPPERAAFLIAKT